MKTYHVYIMASASRVLYIGVTGDLLRRVCEHKEKKVPGFTSRYHVTELVYFEAFGDIHMAIARETKLKGWLRSRKIALIESFNPRWKDLSAELQNPKRRREPGEILRSAQNDKPGPQPLKGSGPSAVGRSDPVAEQLSTVSRGDGLAVTRKARTEPKSPTPEAHEADPSRSVCTTKV